MREALVLADVKRILRRSDDEGAGSALRQTSDALRGVMGASPTLKLALLRYVHVLSVQTGCAYQKLFPTILMMKSAKDAHGCASPLMLEAAQADLVQSST